MGDSTSKNLLILGAGRHQVPLIKAAEASGYRTIIADNKPSSPGREFCSAASMVSATDLNACLALALEHKVCGVLVAGTDQPVRIMAELCARLNLPCYLKPEGALRATNKLVQRQAMQTYGVRQPAFVTVKPGESWEWDTFPAVVKPADSQGQRGVTKVSNRQELESALADSANFSTTNEVVIEAFVPGQEFTASAWLQGGAVAFMALSDRATYSAHSLGVCFQHLYPTVAASGMEQEVAEMLLRIAQAFGMSDGPLYVQMIATSEGPVLVEAAARIGGGHESTLFPRISDFDPVACLIGWLSGKSYNGEPTIHKGLHAVTNFVFAHAGNVAAYSGMETIPTPEVLEGGFYVTLGDPTSGMLDGQGRVGYFIAKAESRAKLQHVAEAFYRGLVVTDSSTQQNLVFLPEESTLLRPRIEAYGLSD